MAPTRRALLAALSAGLAGCGGDAPSETASNTSTDSPTSTPTATPAQESPTATPVQEPTRVALDDDRVRWRVDLPRELVTDPAVDGGRLYVGSSDRQSVDFTDDEAVAGDLTALTLPDGEIEWSRRLDDPATTAPRVHESSVYLVIGRSTGYDGVEQRLVRFDAAGEERWQSSTRDAFVNLLTFDGTNAYLGTSDDALATEGETIFALDLDAGEKQWAVEGGDCAAGRVDGDTLYVDYAGMTVAALATADGTNRWQRSVEALHAPGTSFPSADGHLFAAIEEGEDYGIAAIDADDGETDWTHGLDASSPFVVSGVTVVGEMVIGREFGGLLFARDAATGEARWRRGFDSRVSSTLVADDTLYASGLDGTVAALDVESGEIQWRESVVAGDNAQLQLAGETLLTVTRASEEVRIAGVDVDDGSVQWRRSVAGRLSGGTVADGTLVVTTHDGSVYGVTV